MKNTLLILMMLQLPRPIHRQRAYRLHIQRHRAPAFLALPFAHPGFFGDFSGVGGFAVGAAAVVVLVGLVFAVFVGFLTHEFVVGRGGPGVDGGFGRGEGRVGGFGGWGDVVFGFWGGVGGDVG